jgi:hypothetical protein
MALKFYADLIASAGTIRDICTRPGELIVIDSGPNLKRFDIETLEQLGTTATIHTSPASVVCVGACAVTVSASLTTLSVVNLLTGQVSTLTGGAAQNTAGRGQQICYESVSNRVYAGSTTVGQIVICTVATGAATQTITGVSGRILCLFSNNDGTITIGTDAGEVKLLNVNQTPVTVNSDISNTVTTPNRPSGASSQNRKITGICSVVGQGYAKGQAENQHRSLYAIATADGLLMCQGPNGIDFTLAMIGQNSTTGSSLCAISSGSFIFGNNFSRFNSANSAVTEVCNYSLSPIDCATVENSNAIVAVAMDPTTATAAAAISSTTVRLYKTRARGWNPVNTRCHTPTDIPGTVYRIRDSIGKSSFESLTTIPASGADINTMDGGSYIEMFIPEDSNISYGWDIRRFDT